MKEIPAQKHALQYLEDFFAQHPNQKIILAGHSKGGNLAVYAASQLDPNLQKNIVAVYTFDAPGLHKELTEMCIRDRSYSHVCLKELLFWSFFLLFSSYFFC